MNKLKLVFAAFVVACGLNTVVLASEGEKKTLETEAPKTKEAEKTEAPKTKEVAEKEETARSKKDAVTKAQEYLKTVEEDLKKAQNDKKSDSEIKALEEKAKTAKEVLEKAKANYGWAAAAICATGTAAYYVMGGAASHLMSAENYAKVIPYTGDYVTRGGVVRAVIVAAQAALLYAAYQAYLAYNEGFEDEEDADELE